MVKALEQLEHVRPFRARLIVLELTRDSRSDLPLFVGKCFRYSKSCNRPCCTLDGYRAGSTSRYRPELRPELFFQHANVADRPASVLVLFWLIFVRHSHSRDC